MEVKIVVSYPDGKSEQKELRDEKANSLLGKKIGDIIEGSLLDVKGDLLITGGSDKDGFTMRKDIDGPIRKKILLSKSAGFKPKRDGERRKKRVRGNMITDEIIQINTKLIAKPKKVTKETKEEIKPKEEAEELKEEKPKKAKKEVKKEVTKEKPKPKKKAVKPKKATKKKAVKTEEEKPKKAKKEKEQKKETLKEKKKTTKKKKETTEKKPKKVTKKKEEPKKKEK